VLDFFVFYVIAGGVLFLFNVPVLVVTKGEDELGELRLRGGGLVEKGEKGEKSEGSAEFALTIPAFAAVENFGGEG